jgi:hypothetical protein
MIYRLIDAKKAEIPVNRSCGLLGVSGSGVIAHGVGERGCGEAGNMSQRVDGEATRLPPERH